MEGSGKIKRRCNECSCVGHGREWSLFSL